MEHSEGRGQGTGAQRLPCGATEGWLCLSADAPSLGQGSSLLLCANRVLSWPLRPARVRTLPFLAQGASLGGFSAPATALETAPLETVY